MFADLTNLHRMFFMEQSQIKDEESMLEELNLLIF